MTVRPYLHSGFALLCVTASSAAAWFLHFNLASASVIQVLLVVLIAHRAGFLAATVASIAGVACLNYLFIPPVFTFTVADPQNWVALAVFETCALVVSRLSTEAQAQTRAAIRERQENERLYEASRRMLLIDRQRTPGPQIVQLLQGVFQLHSIALFDGESARLDTAGAAEPALELAARDAFLTGRDTVNAAQDTWSRALRLGGQLSGGLAFRAAGLHPALVNSLVSLTAIAAERARSFESESRAVAGRHTEQLRAAVLDALAHEFKTPLATIRTASGGLLELAAGDPSRLELASLIDEQAARLDHLTTRLLRTAQLDSSAVVPHRRAVSPRHVVDDIVAATDARAGGREIVLQVPDACVLADRELLAMALSQILDNALRYSTPQSAVTISGDVFPDEIQISIHNLGSTIPPEERNRIFERYYRLPGFAHRASGTGLGLSIARKIIDAHQGRVWVTGDDTGTTFHVSLPRSTETQQ